MRYEKVRKHWCCTGCHVLLALLVGLILLYLWQNYDLRIKFASLKDFLIVCIQFLALLALIAAIVAKRLDFYEKREDQGEILQDFRSFLTKSTWGFFGIFVFLFALLLLEERFNDPYFYFFPIFIISFVAGFFSYIFCATLSYADNFLGPKKSDDTKPKP